MIQAITFDFWNTLSVPVDAGDLRCRQIKRALASVVHVHISDSDIERAMTRVWREWDRIWEQELRTFGAEHWVSLLLADLGGSLGQSDQEALVEAMAVSGMVTNPPLVAGLDALLPRLAGRHRLGLICDTGLSPGWMLRQWMESQGILRHFSYLTFSDELGVSKPHPDAFLTTLAHSGVPPEAAAHIGDFPRTDIAGAQAVGMRTIRFAGVRDWGNGAVRADARIKSYDDLEPLLNEWGR